MLLGTAGVYANEPVANDDDFVVVASVEQDLGDGVTLIKELSIEKSKLRAGFSGEKTIRASDSFYHNSTNRLLSKISMQATFYSTSGQNVCYMKNYKYTIDREEPIDAEFRNISESTEINWSGGGSLPNYSRYVVDYDIVGNRTYAGSYGMFVRCASTGNSSNKASANLISYTWGDVVISF